MLGKLRRTGVKGRDRRRRPIRVKGMVFGTAPLPEVPTRKKAAVDAASMAAPQDPEPSQY